MPARRQIGARPREPFALNRANRVKGLILRTAALDLDHGQNLTTLSEQVDLAERGLQA